MARNEIPGPFFSLPRRHCSVLCAGLSERLEERERWFVCPWLTRVCLPPLPPLPSWGGSPPVSDIHPGLSTGARVALPHPLPPPFWPLARIAFTLCGREKKRAVDDMISLRSPPLPLAEKPPPRGKVNKDRARKKIGCRSRDFFPREYRGIGWNWMEWIGLETSS